MCVSTCWLVSLEARYLGGEVRISNIRRKLPGRYVHLSLVGTSKLRPKLVPSAFLVAYLNRLLVWLLTVTLAVVTVCVWKFSV